MSHRNFRGVLGIEETDGGAIEMAAYCSRICGGSRGLGIRELELEEMGRSRDFRQPRGWCFD